MRQIRCPEIIVLSYSYMVGVRTALLRTLVTGKPDTSSTGRNFSDPQGSECPEARKWTAHS